MTVRRLRLMGWKTPTNRGKHGDKHFSQLRSDIHQWSAFTVLYSGGMKSKPSDECKGYFYLFSRNSIPLLYKASIHLYVCLVSSITNIQIHLSSTLPSLSNCRFFDETLFVPQKAQNVNTRIISLNFTIAYTI